MDVPARREPRRSARVTARKPAAGNEKITRGQFSRFGGKMIGTLLTFFAVGLITLVVAGVVLSVVGAVFSLTLGLAAFLLFKVAPVLLIGWIVIKVIDK